MEEASRSDIQEKNNWQWFTIDFNDQKLYGSFWFSPTFNAVIRQHCVYPKQEIIINIPDKPSRPHHPYQYKFIFDWQDEDICGIEVYRRFVE